MGSENWEMGVGGSQKSDTIVGTGIGGGGRQDFSSDPVPPPKLRALTSVSAWPKPGRGEFQ